MMLPPSALPRSLRDHVNPPPADPIVRESAPVLVTRRPARTLATLLRRTPFGTPAGNRASDALPVSSAGQDL
jgi:hypothetical protein